MRRTLTWVHGGIACIVVKLTAVSVKTTFKLEELEFRSAAYAKQSIGLFPQPAPPSSPTLEPHLLSLTTVECDLPARADLEFAMHTPTLCHYAISR